MLNLDIRIKFCNKIVIIESQTISRMHTVIETLVIVRNVILAVLYSRDEYPILTGRR